MPSSAPQRVLVIGPSGAGKTTLALRLSEALYVPTVHLDREFWLPGFIRPEPMAWLNKVALIASRERWVIDGSYLDTIQPRLARAQAIVWIDLPRRVYMRQLLRRILRNYGQERHDLGSGLRERIHFPHLVRAYQYSSLQRPRIERVMSAAISTGLNVVILRSRIELEAFSKNPVAALDRSIRPIAETLTGEFT